MLPLFKFSFTAESDKISTQVLETFYLGGVQVQTAVKYMVWSLEWYEALWLSVFSLTSIYSLFQLFKILRLTHSLKHKKEAGCKVIYTEGKMPTFSFLNYLFWDNSLEMDEVTVESVWKHEIVHIKQKHSLDLLFVQILKNIFWFNPILHLYSNALRQQHEFIADSVVSNTVSKEDYQHALISVLFKNLNPGFVHSFNQCQIKKRIEMMNKMKTPQAGLWKMTGILPILIGVALLFSTERIVAQSADDEVVTVVDKMASPQGGMEMLAKGLQKELKYPKADKKAGVEGKVFVSFIINKDGTLSDAFLQKA
jgi:hypothetical protein